MRCCWPLLPRTGVGHRVRCRLTLLVFAVGGHLVGSDGPIDVNDLVWALCARFFEDPSAEVAMGMDLVGCAAPLGGRGVRRLRWGRRRIAHDC